MSGMASEIAARMAADGASPETGTQAAPPPPGVAPGSAGDVPPSAGTSNTETAPPASAQPESVPYARFKEVNDALSRLRPFGELESFGYDADALRRLAGFEQAYNADPTGVWASMATNLDLPPELVQAVQAHVTSRAAPDPASGAGGTTGDGGPQPAAQLSAEQQELLDWAKDARDRESQTSREERLDSVMSAWDELDTQAGITTGMRTKLTWISAVAGSGTVFDTADALARAAWDARMSERDADLGAVVRQPGQGTVPPALPGTAPGALAAPPVNFGGDIKLATKAAEAAITNGTL